MDTELMGRIEAYVDEVWEDVVADISSLVSHPSIADSSAATAGAPFGEHVRGALDCALSIAERLGYTVGEDEGYVGFAMCLVRAGSRSPPSPMLTWSPPVPAGRPTRSRWSVAMAGCWAAALSTIRDPRCCRSTPALLAA